MKTHLFPAMVIASMACAATTYSQAITNTNAPQNFNHGSYARLSYDNDFFSATDHYYTQGIDAEVVLPALGRSFLRRILLHQPAAHNRYGAGVQHNGYTPSSISSDDILYGDHPFAGVLVAKAFVISADSLHRRRLSSSVHAGVIGPAAGAMEMQVYIHEQLDNIEPHGWQYQVRNDLALNYSITGEQQLFAAGNILLVNGNANASLGTLNTSAGAGITLMAGHIASPFESADKRLSLYGYCTPTATVVGYYAALQGGIFNRTSPYLIDAASISRVLASSRFGIVVAYRGVFLEYFSAFTTKLYETGSDFRWGGVKLGVGL